MEANHVWGEGESPRQSFRIVTSHSCFTSIGVSSYCGAGECNIININARFRSLGLVYLATSKGPPVVIYLGFVGHIFML